MSSKQSPIVRKYAHEANREYPRYQSASRFEYGDIILILLFCFAVYSLFLYYLMPTTAFINSRRAVAELAYNGQIILNSAESHLAQYVPTHTLTMLFAEWFHYFTTW
jgi:hypothetical protein